MDGLRENNQPDSRRDNCRWLIRLTTLPFLLLIPASSGMNGCAAKDPSRTSQLTKAAIALVAESPSTRAFQCSLALPQCD